MNTWTYQPFPIEPFLKRIQRVPKERDLFQIGMRFISWALIRFTMALFFRLKIEGKDKLPKEEGFVLISNHASHLDTLALIASLSFKAFQRTHIAAASDVFFTKTIKGFLCSLFLNLFSFDRKRCGLSGLKKCRQILRNPGQILILFPEGTRSRDGHFHPFKRGIGHLGLLKALIVPAGISGSFEAWPFNRFPLPKKVKLSIGAPFRIEEKKGIAEIIHHLEQKVFQCWQNAKSL